MIMQPINIEGKIQEIGNRPWYPVDVARVNNQVVRIALFRGEYHWHVHSDEDELFYVLKGEMTIQMKKPHSDIILHESEIAVVPKGVEHCPKSDADTYVLMFEPYTLQSRGN